MLKTIERRHDEVLQLASVLMPPGCHALLEQLLRLDPESRRKCADLRQDPIVQTASGKHFIAVTNDLYCWQSSGHGAQPEASSAGAAQSDRELPTAPHDLGSQQSPTLVQDQRQTGKEAGTSPLQVAPLPSSSTEHGDQQKAASVGIRGQDSILSAQHGDKQSRLAEYAGALSLWPTEHSSGNLTTAPGGEEEPKPDSPSEVSPIVPHFTILIMPLHNNRIIISRTRIYSDIFPPVLPIL